MKRIHIHAGVEHLDASIKFYSALFGADPIKIKDDYAKWMLDEPSLNFAISTKVADKGIDHVGVQVDDENELQELRERLQSDDMSTFDEGETVCCYARADKSWITDPDGIAWEAYRTMEDAEVYSAISHDDEETCCTPETRGQPGCCEPSAKTVGCCA